MSLFTVENSGRAQKKKNRNIRCEIGSARQFHKNVPVCLCLPVCAITLFGSRWTVVVVISVDATEYSRTSNFLRTGGGEILSGDGDDLNILSLIPEKRSKVQTYLSPFWASINRSLIDERGGGRGSFYFLFIFQTFIRRYLGFNKLTIPSNSFQSYSDHRLLNYELWLVGDDRSKSMENLENRPGRSCAASDTIVITVVYMVGQGNRGRIFGLRWITCYRVM